MSSDTADVSALYVKAGKLKADIERGLEGLKGQKAGDGGNVAEQQRLGMLSKQFDDLVMQFTDALASMPDKGQSRTIWDRRAKGLKDDAEFLQGSVQKECGAFFAANRDEENRKKLLGNKPNKKDDDDQQALLKEHQGLRQAANMLDEMISQGSSTWDQIAGQNKVLKGARRKLLDAANSLGVSQSLVAVIDRRQTGDKYLIYGGMALTLFILFSLWYLLRM